MGADGHHAQPAEAVPGKRSSGLRSWLSSPQLRSEISESEVSITVAGPRCNVRHAPREVVLAFRSFPTEHWRKIWSTNPLERLNKEIKRRTRVVGIFPNDAAIIRLVGALLLEQQEEWQLEGRRVFSELSMAKLDSSNDPGQDQLTVALTAAA